MRCSPRGLGLLLAWYHVRRLRQHCAPPMNQHDRSCVAGLTCGPAQKASVFIFHRFFGDNPQAIPFELPYPVRGTVRYIGGLKCQTICREVASRSVCGENNPPRPIQDHRGIIFTLVHVSYAQVLQILAIVVHLKFLWGGPQAHGINFVVVLEFDVGLNQVFCEHVAVGEEVVVLFQCSEGGFQ